MAMSLDITRKIHPAQNSWGVFGLNRCPFRGHQTRRVSELLCMSNLAHASKLKEHDDNGDFQEITGRAA